ncbi:P-loop NTPase [Rhabdothermincola salaria]|uniref:P-loop NTPase n=1 Tax=Rhabdothermincola salaria TaxID=2903142 RepID=UPI001E444398|nr:P-loop NTPase [Rhabdothermincola salaria]MCD9624598.1 Mrp/NBP35 family ATP-binding protein [Rhabdothermincola salaria]
MSAVPTSDDVLATLRGVIDPELGTDIVELGMARRATVDDAGHVVVDVALTTAGCPLRAQLQSEIKARIADLPGVESVKIDWGEMTPEQKSAAMAKARWNVKESAPTTAVPPTTRVLAVASGKGGVGKSSVSANLAAALAAQGYAVGVLDADIWGFSLPRMLGLDARLEATKDASGSTRIVPQRLDIGAGRLEVVSMGLLVDDETDALMWRGLILNRAVQHFLEDVAWPDDLQYLVIDMPPGTGDVQMGLARMLPQAEMIVVTTPALAAQKVAARAVTMARKSYLRVLGAVENMSAFECEHGTTYPLFGSGGGAALAHDAEIPLLGAIPLEPSVSSGSDVGRPIALGDGAAADAFRAIASRLADDLAPPIDMGGCSARLLAAATSALDALDAEGT